MSPARPIPPPPAWAQAAIAHLRAAGEPARWDPSGAVVSRHGGLSIRLHGRPGEAEIELHARGTEALCALVLEAALDAELHRGLAEGAEPEHGCGCCDPEEVTS